MNAILRRLLLIIGLVATGAMVVLDVRQATVSDEGEAIRRGADFVPHKRTKAFQAI